MVTRDRFIFYSEDSINALGCWIRGSTGAGGFTSTWTEEDLFELYLLFKITHGLCHFPTGIFTPRQIPQL